MREDEWITDKDRAAGNRLMWLGALLTGLFIWTVLTAWDIARAILTAMLWKYM